MGIQGIIRPPPEIRAVADKTASFVAKNGRGFETRIITSAKGKTPKFAFLHDSSPFHAYYEDRIVFFSNGGVDEKKQEEPKEGTVTGTGTSTSTGTSEDVATSEGQQEGEGGEKPLDELKEQPVAVVTPATETLTARKAKSIVDPVARALLVQRARIQVALDSEKTEEDKTTTTSNHDESKYDPKEELVPPTQTYTTIVPPKNLSQAQLEIIKLTAQFVALNGKGGSFLRELTVREWESPMWGFLQPRHGHYAYFTQLVDLYRRLLQEAVTVHEHEIKQKDKQKQQEKNDGTSEGRALSSLLELSSLKKMVGIDSVSEEQDAISQQIKLIEETAGDVSKCLEHAAFQAEYHRYHEEKRRLELENKEGNGRIGGAARVDWHDFVIVETIEFAVDEVVEMLPPPPPPAAKVEEPVVPTKRAAEAMDESSDEEDDGEKIQVVDDYVSKVVSSQAKFASEARTHVIDPITKKSIPIADMTEHMRIQLMDPKWAAEKAKFMDKQKESNLVGGDAIARNMNAFAKARTDLFGSSVSFRVWLLIWK